MNKLLKALGPGILFASTAIGVSHLVQSTRAGALYGFGLIGAIISANLFKYPFFEYGSRYANATGRSLIDGYRRLGKPVFYTYVGVTVLSMFFVSAAVGAVTAGFMTNLFPLEDVFGSAAFEVSLSTLFLVCVVILLTGKYKGLDSLIKVVGAVLLISTLISFVLVIIQGPSSGHVNWVLPELTGEASALPFIIALMGWMPTAVDLSTWNSLWTLERISDSGYRPTLKETLFDFNFGYIASAILALCFLTLGAFLMYDMNMAIPDNSTGFSNMIIELYTSVIGDWSYPLMAAAGFSIMFGTCIAVFDGYARVAERSICILQGGFGSNDSQTKAYRWCVALTALISFCIVWFAGNSLKFLVDLATVISFLIAPLIAVANFYLVLKDVPDAAKPKRWLRVLSWLGILFLTVFSLIYLTALFLDR